MGISGGQQCGDIAVCRAAVSWGIIPSLLGSEPGQGKESTKRGDSSVGADIPLVTGVGVVICGCCPGHWHLSPPGQSLAAVTVQGGKQSLFYRQEEALAHLQTREIFNFKARSYFLFKIQTDRDGC